MTRPLQKKKNKSSLPRVRQKPKSKAVNIKSNPIVAAHWDQSLTLRQNYKNLGLSSRLKSSTGGVEKAYRNTTSSSSAAEEQHDGLLLLSGSRRKKGATTQVEPARVRVIRDGKGAITGIVRDEKVEERRKRRNPLNDPLNEFETDSEDDDEEEGAEADNASDQPRTTRRREEVASQTVGTGGVPAGIVPELEESAKYGKRKRARKQSQREQEWIQQLVDRHGEDFGAMMREEEWRGG